MSETPATDTASRILDAVMHLILQGGLPSVTLSAVCQHAGISKGGLIHHFPNKERLVDAFIERSTEQYWALIEQAVAPYSAGQGRRAKAFVDLVLAKPELDPDHCEHECLAVMLAFIQSGGQLPIAQRLYSRLTQLLTNDGLGRPSAEMLVAATDGMWFQSIIEPSDSFQPRVVRVRAQLMKFIDLHISQSNKRRSQKVKR
jgi:AcrR family transcriptional regulator